MDRKRQRTFREILGWKVGDRCAVQLKTKKVYGRIVGLGEMYRLNCSSNEIKVIYCATVEFDEDLLRHHVPIKELLEDYRSQEEE